MTASIRSERRAAISAGITLTQNRYAIDAQTYFRYEFFASANWQQEPDGHGRIAKRHWYRCT